MILSSYYLEINIDLQDVYHLLKQRDSASTFYTFSFHVNKNYSEYAVTKLGFIIQESDDKDVELMCGESGDEKDE